jgi:hypothetical protein
LRRGPDRLDEVDVLAQRLGGRVGLDAVKVPASAADYGFRWNRSDMVTQTWWPQGITSSADASDTDDIAGRRIVVVAWYAKKRRGVGKGVRLSFVDVTDPDRPRYRHVLLVTAGGSHGWHRWRRWRDDRMRPVPVHAGGIVWYGPSILVADTRGGIRVFDVDDICRVADRDGYLGYRFVLPQRSSYAVEHGSGEPFRFSFISLDRSGGHQLIAGEYGRGEQTTRLTRFALDPATLALATESDEVARPVEMVVDGRGGMQGATIVGGTWYVTTSRGPARRGTLWTRRPGEDFVAHEGVLSVGPEDVTYWPQHDRLWTCSEWPGMRFVYAMKRSQFT